MTYPSDLSEAQWAKLEKFFERLDPRGARPKYAKQRVVEAVLYRLREGCRWRALPHDFPPWDTVYDHWRRWQKRGVWQQAVLVLGTRWREVSLGRSRRALRHAILDSQSVQRRRGPGTRLPRWQAHQGPLAPRGQSSVIILLIAAPVRGDLSWKTLVSRAVEEDQMYHKPPFSGISAGCR